ncbi:Putative transposase (identified by ISEscan HMM) [Escherichia coli]|nr:Putative transposase (identified by ISEscan HMM) [Escherichia coli]
MSHVRCFQWLGGVPELVVPDNLKSATSVACKHDPDVNPTYQQMLEHYNVAVCLRGHVNRKIKPKLKLAFRLLNAGSWPESGMIFYSLASLNQRIRELLERLNNKIMQKLGYSRAELFIQLDKPALKPLPEASYSYTGEESQSSCRLPRGNRQTLLGSMFAVRPATGSMDLRRTGKTLQSGAGGCTRASVLMATVPATSTCLKLIDSMPRTPERLLEWAGHIGSETHSASYTELSSTSGTKLSLLPWTPEPS